MGETAIEWTDKVWNPVTGCSKVSQGCKNCYAERVFPRPYPGRAFTDVRCHEDRLDAPLHWRKPCRVFVNSMSDLFHEAVPFEFILDVMGVCGVAQQHTFQILTKRPQRMLDFSRWIAGTGEHISMAEWPRNVWLGVSVEDQKTAEERIPLLLQTPAVVRWTSYEPALGPIDFSKVHHPIESASVLTGIYWRVYPNNYYCTNRFLRWLVCGGESGPNARPMHPDWARSVRDQCVAAGVPFFFKQWGEWAPSGDKVGKKHSGRLLDGREWNEYP